MHEIEILAFYITSRIGFIMIYTKNFAETLYCDLQIRLNLGQNVRNWQKNNIIDIFSTFLANKCYKIDQCEWWMVEIITIW